MQRALLIQLGLIIVGLTIAMALPFLGLERFENDQAPLLIAFATLAATGSLVVHLRWPHNLELYVSGAAVVFGLLSLMALVGVLAETPATDLGVGGIMPLPLP